MDVFIPCLKVSQRHAQLYRKHLLSRGVLDRSFSTQKHPDGSVTLPVLPSVLPQLDLEALKECVTEGSVCELVQIPAPPLSKKGRLKSVREKLLENLQKLLTSNGRRWSEDLDKDIPSHWQKHGDLVLLGESGFTDAVWNQMGPEIWRVVAVTLGGKRLAQRKKVSPDGFRTPAVMMLLGDSSLVTHIDNHIRYEFDVTKCMFSSGNITEKLRVAAFDCTGETVVDLYAGIGYFTLPYLVHAKAAHVHACEWNPDAVKALHRNLLVNGVSERCTVHHGDNRQLPLSDLADRVNLGLIPSSEEGWPVACGLLKRDRGGVLHIHQNISTPLQQDALALIARRISALLRDVSGGEWMTHISHVEHVKTYAPHVSHVVLDLLCRPLLDTHGHTHIV